MKLILFIVTQIFFTHVLMGQSHFIEYANEMRNVRKLLMNEEYESAYTKYKRVAEKCNYVLTDDIRMFSAICLNVGKCEEGMQAFQKAVSQGHNFKDDYLDFFKNKCQQFDADFENALSELRNKYLDDLNIAYRDTVVKYYQIDQAVRRRYNRGNGSDRELTYTDSIVIKNVWPFVEKYGVADERAIGKEAADELFIILLHYDADKSNKLGPYLLDALLNGKIKPENYAWIIDRRRVWGHQLRPYYYQIPNGFDELSREEITEINRRRNSIGCRPLSDYDIRKENDGTWIMAEK